MSHVVLIDDDVDLVQANRLYLESQGYKVSSAFSGKDGWELLGKVTPDILVIDCMMEEFTTGFELAWDISLKFPKMPMIMLTGVRDHMSSKWQFGSEDREWLPIHRFLEKPVPAEKLLGEIKQLLSSVCS